MIATISPMAAKKNTKTDDRHKPSRMVRLPEALAEVLDDIASEQFNSLAEQVKIAVREYLERKDRLPKPDRPKS